jgi:hypothetical protein
MASTRTAKPARRKTNTARTYMAEPINYGGIILPRHEVYRLMLAEGHPRIGIDRWMQGYDSSVVRIRMQKMLAAESA